ncbi:TonB-dependent receptor SusC [Pedobacter glucosidilyticus]|nr:TonB-dependent receptor [Pedobacter glucosidilyticus]KHJ39323.1 TonB-dependent receptor SusC [Pedobacter glucosidilyticus]
MTKKILLFMAFLFISITSLQAQTKQVKGIVNDDKGDPLIGVAVTLKGSTQGTQTNVNGEFVLNVPTNNAVLQFKYIGYKAKEVAIGSQTALNVILDVEATMLNEVVAIGYGTVKRKDLTGAVASVNAEVIAAAPVSSALEAIAGRVAGLNITSTEGSPEAEINVRVRGGGSITQDNSPLYIVDGFPLPSIADLAPQDIETIDVLKDASSTAIYGARGANGVILITTKSAKAGKTSISFNSFTGVRQLAKKLDVLSPLDYATWQYELSLLNNSPQDYVRYFGNYQDIDLYADVPANDWQEIVFGRNGSTYNQNFSINTGTEKTKISLSHNYVKDRAIMQLSGYERQNLNFRLNHKLYKSLSIDLGVRYSDTKIEGGGANEVNEVSSGDSRLKHAMLYPPFAVAGLTTTTETDDEFNLYNPLVALQDNDQLIRRKAYNLNGAVNYDILPRLRIRSEIGYDGFRNDQDRFFGNTTYYVRNVPSAENQDSPALILNNTERNGFRSTNTLNFNLDDLIGKNHDLTFLAGHEFLRTRERILTNVIHGFPETFTFDNTRKLSTQGQANSIDNNFQPDYKILSFFSRANYNFNGKYLFTASVRADGSSRFAPGNQWGYFPSASAAWRISQEKFMSGTKNWLSDLKLRASYGAAGNDRIPGNLINQIFLNSTTTWVNGTNNYWAASKTMANPDLKWETTVTNNIGLDVALFNSKINVIFDAYKNRTKDLLIAFPVAGTGYDIQFRNIGETENKGLEVTLNWNAVRKTNFDFTVNANIGINRNKVINLGGLENIPASSGWASTEIGVDYLVQQGFPIGRISGYVSDGRYEVSDFESYNATTNRWTLKDDRRITSSLILNDIRPGAMKIKDLNGDNIINLSDRTVIGNTNPLHTGGISLNARVYNFDIATYFNWSYGNDVYNANKVEYTSTSKYTSRNMLGIMASGQRWTNLRADGTLTNDPAELEALNANTTMWSPYTRSYALSDWAVEDGSFLRLATVTLGYTLPEAISRKLKMSKMRIYASGYNLFLLTNYSGFDPEVSTRRRTPLTPGVDYSAYPRSKSYVVGLNVNF